MSLADRIVRERAQRQPMRTAHYRCFYIDLTQTRHMHYVAFNILDGLFRLKLYGKNMIQAMDAVDQIISEAE